MIPETEEDLAEAIRAASRPLRIRGGGTRDIGQDIDAEVLSTTGLTGVTLYEPGALTLVARAGTPLAEIEAMLASEGQRLPFEPMDHRGLLRTSGTPTLGGVIAANVSGPRRIQVGAARDFTLGVRFVDGTGMVLKNGGRVMKNVTGYDLVKLMAGSWGTLGVMTEVSLKVGAIPETEATLITRGLDVTQAVAAMSAALGSPFDISGAGHLDGAALGGESETRIRIEGLAGSVAYRAGRLREDICAGWDLIEGAESAARWQELRDVSPFHGKPGHVWRYSVKPSDASALTAWIARERPGAEFLYDWGGGLVWALVAPGGELRPNRSELGENAIPGHATLVRADEQSRFEVAVFEPLSPIEARISQGLLQKFDPRGILNHQLMGI
jgi:glycolate oxidase FAD binding subunit